MTCAGRTPDESAHHEACSDRYGSPRSSLILTTGPADVLRPRLSGRSPRSGISACIQPPLSQKPCKCEAFCL